MGHKVNYLHDTLRGYFTNLIYANYFITKCKVHFHEKRHLFFLRQTSDYNDRKYVHRKSVTDTTLDVAA